MKIGILTLPLHTNYGGILQAYALMTVLESKGHEVWLIDTQFNKVPTKKIITRFIKTLFRRIQGKTDILFPLKLRKKAYKTYTKPFIDKHIKKITMPFKEPELMGKEIAIFDFDAFVVGSDQIWNPKYFPHIEVAFFSFLKDKPMIKLSYAPSFGSDQWIYKPEKQEICKRLIQEFHAVSVREDVGKEFCKNFLGKEADLVLDPTMLLTLEQYVALLGNIDKKSNGKMFVYVLDLNEDKKKAINEIVLKKGLSAYQLDLIEGYESSPLEWRTKAKVEDWILNFYKAEFVVTDSFHGTVFAILFNKPFFSLINYKRGAVRFKSLLNQFGLLDRMIGSSENLSDQVISHEINWDKVNKILDQKREISNQFLDKALKK